MSPSRPSLLALLPATLLVLAAAARADDVAVEAFLPSPDQAGFLGFPSTRTPGHLGFDVGVVGNYSLHSLSARALGRGDGMALRHHLDATALLQLGIGSRTAVGLRVPVLLHQRDDASPERQNLASAGAGNPALEARVRLWGDPVRADGSVQDGGGVALRGLVHLPVGGELSYARDSAYRTELALIADVQLFGIGAGLSFGHQHRYENSEPAFVPMRDRLKLAGGVRLPLPLLSRAYPGKVQDTLVVELEAATEARDMFAARTTPVEGRLGYRVGVADTFTTLAVGAGFRDAIGAPDARVLLAFGYSPRKHDQDGDGVPDGEDGCVHLPEDRDGFQDDDGCADDDNDGDLILDEDDRCPLAPAEMGADEDEDGCTD